MYTSVERGMKTRVVQKKQKAIQCALLVTDRTLELSHKFGTPTVQNTLPHHTMQKVANTQKQTTQQRRLGKTLTMKLLQNTHTQNRTDTGGGEEGGKCVRMAKGWTGGGEGEKEMCTHKASKRGGREGNKGQFVKRCGAVDEIALLFLWTAQPEDG
ncbi:hypothetical protein GPALN_006280 [Globodera pallida]|nr:hypothetical protein GPALN_006280 [Globodera pallida]